jgi:predicted dehydrogenase
VATLFEYAGGATGLLSYSNYLPPFQNHFHVHGTTGTIAVEANRLVIEAQNQAARVVELPAEQAYIAMWNAIAQAFREGHDPFYTPERALQDVAILEAVDLSIKSGARAPVAAIRRI